MATTERVDTNAKAAAALLNGSFDLMRPRAARAETLAQAQVYATLALLEEISEVRKLLTNGSDSDICQCMGERRIDGTCSECGKHSPREST